MKNAEEAFADRKAGAAAAGAGKPVSFFDRMKKSGTLSTVVYIVLGVVLALAAKEALVFGLNTDTPVVAVVSSSMQHDSPAQTYYGWLETNLGYNRSYIDSWPISGGFLVGDMPIVQGADGYNVGDIIVYSVPGQSVPIIHRIIVINPDGSYQTKGDNNLQQLTYEFSVRSVQVHGKVIAVIPKLGYFKVFTMRVFGV